MSISTIWNNGKDADDDDDNDDDMSVEVYYKHGFRFWYKGT